MNKPDNSWTRAIDAIVRGEFKHVRFVRLGPTPELLKDFGLAPADLSMSAAKIEVVRKTHPEISLDLLYRLPALLEKPLAVFPSSHRDGSIVVLLVLNDIDGNPVIVPIAPGIAGHPNAVLSVYGKSAGFQWVETQIARSKKDGFAVYEKIGFADSEPKPESAIAISSSSGPIPADGSTKPKRHILKIPKKSS